MADLATLQTWLSEAENALHGVLTTGGTMRVRHQTNGADKWIEYGTKNIAELRRYIDDLKREIAALQGTGHRRAQARRLAF